MKRLLLALAITLAASSAYAAYCRTHTYIGPDGSMTTCTTCCYGNGNCTTTCI